ncbi:hypothetical protein DK867_02880 [Ochrobactrum sp. POC9]|uniref:hypothetical protein n=1 Tax=Brucella tritici TaxID=94626 RepID=UPI000D707679|nr:hypothetical protein [Brucella tritici]PWU76232.1 hypothetical protein DK867_02880 [Ochrobactrum sp. POC9]
MSPNDCFLPNAIAKRLAAMPTHESAHALFSRKTEYAEINSGLAGHAVRQPGAKPISIAVNLATSKLQSISFWESYLERFH